MNAVPVLSQENSPGNVYLFNEGCPERATSHANIGTYGGCMVGQKIGIDDNQVIMVAFEDKHLGGRVKAEVREQEVHWTSLLCLSLFVSAPFWGEPLLSTHIAAGFRQTPPNVLVKGAPKASAYSSARPSTIFRKRHLMIGLKR